MSFFLMSSILLIIFCLIDFERVWVSELLFVMVSVVIRMLRL